jgi:hypothetical protein
VHVSASPPLRSFRNDYPGRRSCCPYQVCNVAEYSSRRSRTLRSFFFSFRRVRISATGVASSTFLRSFSSEFNHSNTSLLALLSSSSKVGNRKFVKFITSNSSLLLAPRSASLCALCHALHGGADLVVKVLIK